MNLENEHRMDDEKNFHMVSKNGNRMEENENNF